MVRPGSEGPGRRASIDVEGVPKILCCSFFADAMAGEDKYEHDGQRHELRTRRRGRDEEEGEEDVRESIEKRWGLIARRHWCVQ